jgi:hypothetical protein
MTTLMMKAVNNILTGDGKKKVPLFTPPHEAFIVTMHANNEDRWKARIEYLKEEGLDIVSGKFPKRKAKVDEEKVPDPLHDARYSRSDAGQERFDTFTEEGLTFYMETIEAIRDAKRDQDNARDMKVLEMRFLEHLQKKFAKDLESATSKSKKRKLGETALLKKNKRKSLGSMAALDEDEDFFDVDLAPEDDDATQPGSP